MLEGLRLVVHQARLAPFTVQSNFARENSLEVALAASLGLITTLQTTDTAGRTWMVTARGARFIHENGF